MKPNMLIISMLCGVGSFLLMDTHALAQENFEVKISDDGTRYEGTFVDGKLQGLGTALFPMVFDMKANFAIAYITVRESLRLMMGVHTGGHLPIMFVMGRGLPLKQMVNHSREPMLRGTYRDSGYQFTQVGQGMKANSLTVSGQELGRCGLQMVMFIMVNSPKVTGMGKAYTHLLMADVMKVIL